MRARWQVVVFISVLALLGLVACQVTESVTSVPAAVPTIIATIVAAEASGIQPGEVVTPTPGDAGLKSCPPGKRV